MKDNVTLTVMSLLSILLSMFHLADDIVRGMSPGGLFNLIAVVFWVVWLYATLSLAGRRSGYLSILVVSLFLLVIPVLHLRGPGVGFGTHRSDGLFFVWTILALSVSALFSVILCLDGLWSLRRRQLHAPTIGSAS